MGSCNSIKDKILHTKKRINTNNEKIRLIQKNYRISLYKKNQENNILSKFIVKNDKKILIISKKFFHKLINNKIKHLWSDLITINSLDDYSFEKMCEFLDFQIINQKKNKKI